jgi:hypothetical protein
MAILFYFFAIPPSAKHSLQGMFGWARNSRIIIVLGIKITVVHPNTNMLFRNNENICYSIGEME